MSGPGTPTETPGHRVITEAEAVLIQLCRSHGDALMLLTRTLGQNNADQRWLAIAQTHFQEGLMAAVRSITKPEFF